MISISPYTVLIHFSAVTITVLISFVIMYLACLSADKLNFEDDDQPKTPEVKHD